MGRSDQDLPNFQPKKKKNKFEKGDVDENFTSDWGPGDLPENRKNK